MSVPVRRRSAAVIGGLSAALLLAACGSSSSDTASTPTASATTDPACSAYAAYGSHPGTQVTVFTSIKPPEQQQYEKSWADFAKCTGITVKYEVSGQFEAELPTRIKGGNPPDIAFIPQPGLLAKLASNPDTAPKAAPADVSAAVDKYWAPSFKTYGTVGGTFYAAPLSSNMKSLVWYSPATFKAHNYAIPTTWDGLMTLSDQMVKDGIKPWCGGIESGGATGWLATDWLEQTVLRQSGGDVYDKWVNHDIKFNSPEITKAMELIAGWMKNPAWVNAGFGDVKTIATTKFQDGGKPILVSQGAKCGMYQQASFYAAQWDSFQKGAKIAADGDAFAFFLPAMPESPTKPVIGGGEFVAAYADRPEVQAFQLFLTSPEWATAKVKLGGWVSANNGVPQDAYQDAISALSAKILGDKETTFRFDASDMMPAAVGSGEEWKQMTAWFAEDKPTADVLSAIDAAWPAS
jgi:alpha-glucoside transport system substrate-binding protein